MNRSSFKKYNPRVQGSIPCQGFHFALVAQLAEHWTFTSLFFAKKMDWSRVLTETHEDNLYTYLLSIPQAQWSQVDPRDEESLLHYAARGNNHKAVILLAKSGININGTKCIGGYTPFDVAFRFGMRKTVEVFCALGVEVKTTMIRMYIFKYGGYSIQTNAYILIANGVRVTDEHPGLFSFQRGILKARSAIVALLKLYKSYKTRLNRVGCKYMMQELVVAVWVTRTNRYWKE